MPQLRIHPRRAFGGGFGIIGGGGALMYMDGLGVQKNRGPIKLLELSWAISRCRTAVLVPMQITLFVALSFARSVCCHRPG